MKKVLALTAGCLIAAAAVQAEPIENRTIAAERKGFFTSRLRLQWPEQQKAKIDSLKSAWSGCLLGKNARVFEPEHGVAQGQGKVGLW